MLLKRAIWFLLALLLATFISYLPGNYAEAAVGERDFARYVLAPPGRDLFPQKVVQVTLNGGAVETPEGLMAPGGTDTTLRRTPGTDPQMVLDFGKIVSGRLTVATTRSSKPELRVAFGESLAFLNKNSDFNWKEYGTYHWEPSTGPDLLTTGDVTFRYLLVFLNTDGEVSIDYLKLHFTSFLGTPDTYEGYFLSSDELLNKIWYTGAYTLDLNTVGAEDPPMEQIGRAVQVSGRTAERIILSKTGLEWRDYTLEMEIKRPVGGYAVGWMFRATDINNGYMWQLVGVPGTTSLRLHARQNGNYQKLADIPLEFTDEVWYRVRIELNGSQIKTFINDRLLDERNDNHLKGGRVGFRQCCGEYGQFRNLKVTAPDGRSLFSDDFSGGSEKWDVKTEPSLILDGSKRDREVWAGDLAVQSRVQTLTRNRPDAIRNSLAILAENQHPDGFIPPSPFFNFTSVLYDYCAWWVITFADYYFYSGDRAFVEKYYAQLSRQMEWFPGKVTAAGLLVKDDGIEWSYSADRKGAVTYLNILYFKALRDAAFLAASLGQIKDATRWQDRATSLIDSINSNLFDSRRGVYINSDQDTLRASQDANALAILFGVAPRERWNGILDYIRQTMWNPYGSTNVDISYGTNYLHDKRIWPFMGYFELEARFLAGDDRNALDLARRMWGRMLQVDPGTAFWEWMSPQGYPELPMASLAHGWSAGVTASLTERVLGIRPTAPGYSRFEINPHPGDLSWVKGRVPTPNGPIDFAWEKQGDNLFMVLAVPPDTLATLAVPRVDIYEVKKQDGGTAGLSSGNILSPGQYLIKVHWQ